MATHLRENMSIDLVADILDELCAGLHAEPAVSQVLPVWTALASKADQLAAEGQQLERAQRRARARLAVCDTNWDRTVAAFGRAVVDASDGKRDKAPYIRFFSSASPSAVQHFGIQREVDVAREWLVELSRSPDEALAKNWVSRLTEATDTLDQAQKDRNQAVKALGPNQTAIILFIDDVNSELDRLEGQLKQTFPTQPGKVAAFLAATRSNRAPAVGAADEPEPALPAKAVEGVSTIPGRQEPALSGN